MTDDKSPSPGTSESKTARGEDIAKGHTEPGSVDLGKDEHGRPAGGSTARFATGIDPQDPVDPADNKVRTA